MRTMAAIGAGAIAMLLAAQPASPPQRRTARAGRPDGGAPDGGPRRTTRRTGPRILGDPPGSLRLTNSPPEPDAGLPAVNTRAPTVSAEVDSLRKRVAALEALQSRMQEQSEQLAQLSTQLEALRSQLGADAQQQRESQAQRAAQRQKVENAALVLSQADARLSTGSEDIEDALQTAEAAFTGEALRDVANAREALRNRDLTTARSWLAAAASQARRGP